MQDSPKQTSANDTNVFLMDRPMPHNREAEIAVLGAMLLDPEAATTAFSALKIAKPFHFNSHQLIFNAMLELHTGKTEVSLDPLILADHLERSGKLEEVGGREYITQLMDSVPTAAHIEHYVQIVRQTAILRQVIATCSETIMKCYNSDDDANTLLGDIEKEVFEITGQTQSQDMMTIDKLSIEAIDYLNMLIEGNSNILGIKTGYAFDRMITGLKPGELFVLAARPSIGKTALALNMATNIALDPVNPTGVGIFSLEMPALQIVLRMICSLARISMSDFRYHHVDKSGWSTVMEVADRLKNANIIIDDTGAIDILELRAKARRMVKNNVKVIFIDYLQLIKGHTKTNASRENEVAMISGSLKAMAKELKIPVVVLAQVNRQAEQAGEKPKLAQLRESGAIEQDADVVALLHREREKQYAQKINNDEPLQAELIIAKNRNGSTGTQDLLFFPQYTRFENAAQNAEEA